MNSLKTRCFLCGQTLDDWEQHELRFSDRFSSKIGRVCTWDYAEHLSKASKYIVVDAENGVKNRDGATPLSLL